MRWTRTRDRPLTASTFSLFPLLILAACFTGEFAQGLVCEGDDDCSPLRCVDGLCQGKGELAVCGNGLLEEGEECDDGNISDGDSCPSSCVFLEVPTLALDYAQVKQFLFSWEPAEGAEFYQLFESRDGAGEFLKVGENIHETFLSLTVSVHLRQDAIYKLEACDEERCKESEPVTIEESVRKAVGFFKPGNTNGFNDFGSSVALSSDGGILAVGVPRDDAAGVDGVQGESNLDFGAVYIFVRTPTFWEQQAYIKASAAHKGDLFGTDVSLSADGNTLAVGAPNESYSAKGINNKPGEDSAPSSGAAYVFERSGTTWTQGAYIKSSTPDIIDHFGSSVELSSDGSTFIVAATGESSSSSIIDTGQDLNDASNSGAVYAFSYSEGSWGQQAYIKAFDASSDSQFGVSISLSSDGNTLAVGSVGLRHFCTNDTMEGSDAEDGAIYILTREAGDWKHHSFLSTYDACSNNKFGSFVAMSGDASTLFTADHDRGYVFIHTGVPWTSQDFQPLSWSYTSGAALSENGDLLVVRSPGGERAGIFTRTDSVWSERSTTSFSAPQDSSWYDSQPHTVTLSSDGATLAVGDPDNRIAATGVGEAQFNLGPESSGAVYLY